MIETRRSDIDELRGALEGARMAHLEAAGEIELANLLPHSLDDLRSAMTGIDAPQARCPIDYAATVIGREAGALGADEEARLLFVLAVRREGHPECFEGIGF